ncbi:hypothetical protein KIL84_007998, partial [Mauremys mutica]
PCPMTDSCFQASLHACKLLELLRCPVLGSRHVAEPLRSPSPGSLRAPELFHPFVPDWLARIMDCFSMPCLLS